MGNPIEWPMPYEEVRALVLFSVNKAVPWLGRQIDREELESEAWLIAVKCAKDWTPDRGCKFSSYICNYIDLHFKTISRKGRLASLQSRIVTTRGVRRAALSFSAPAGLDGTKTKADVLVCGRDWRNSARAADARIDLHDMLRFLDERSQKILWQMFGVGQTLEEIAEELGVTRERIRQIVGKAMQKLRSRRGIVPEMSNTEIKNANSKKEPKMSEGERLKRMSAREFVHEFFKKHGPDGSIYQYHTEVEKEDAFGNDGLFYKIRRELYPNHDFGSLRGKHSKAPARQTGTAAVTMPVARPAAVAQTTITETKTSIQELAIAASEDGGLDDALVSLGKLAELYEKFGTMDRLEKAVEIYQKLKAA